MHATCTIHNYDPVICQLTRLHHDATDGNVAKQATLRSMQKRNANDERK